VVSQERLKQLTRGLRRQRVEPQLTVHAPASPAVPVLGTVIDEQEQPGRREAFGEDIEERLRFGVDPVEILEDEEQRLDLALAEEKALARVECPLASLRGIENLPGWVVPQHVEQGEDRRELGFQGPIERQELAGDLLPDSSAVVASLDLKV